MSNLLSRQLLVEMDPDEIQIFVKGNEGKTVTIEIRKVQYINENNIPCIHADRDEVGKGNFDLLQFCVLQGFLVYSKYGKIINFEVVSFIVSS